jgi:hypothetical protein
VTSARKIRANRTNARASSGPKTAAGKAQSARNAFRHGFNVPIWLDPDLASDVEALAQRIAGKGADANVQDSARRIAEAQIDLRRVLSASFLSNARWRMGRFRPRRQSARSLRGCRRSSARWRRSIATSAAPCRGANSPSGSSTSCMSRPNGARAMQQRRAAARSKPVTELSGPSVCGALPHPRDNLELCKIIL